MTRERIDLGKEGEDLAVDHLEKNGYKIVKQNYRSLYGELDVIALDKEILCFIEIKTRTSDLYGHPLESITKSKINKIAKTAMYFMGENDLLDSCARFDVVSILQKDSDKFDIEIIKNAFELN